MDSFGKPFTGERGVENSLLLAGLLAPRFTFGPGARQRLNQGGGTGIRDSLIVLSQILGAERQERGEQEGMGRLFNIMSGKAPVTPETLAHIPREGWPLAGQYLAQQAEEKQFRAGVKDFEHSRAERAVSPIMPGSVPSSVAPYTQDVTEARQAFQAPPVPPPMTIEDLTRLSTYGPRAQKFGETLYKAEDISAYRNEQNQIKREMQQITKETREASDATKMYAIDKRFEGLQASIAGMMEKVKAQETGKADRQLEKLASNMERLEKLITAKHEDVATQEQGRTQRVGTQEAGKTMRQTERINAPPKVAITAKQTEGDKSVQAIANEFKALKDQPSIPGSLFGYGSKPAKSAEQQAREMIDAASKPSSGIQPSQVNLMRRAYDAVFRNKVARDKQIPPKVTGSPQEEADRIMKGLGM